jgi:4-hydroxy-tetrahydrodipicolinate reductase
MVRTVITGVTGRMGSTLVRLVRDDMELDLMGATEKVGSAAVGLDAGLACKLGTLEVPVEDSLEKALGKGERKAQVVIDFTSPDASVAHARTCADAGVGLVVGSTGFSPEARAAVAECATRIPVVMAPNMSVGVNLVIQVAAHLARVLGDSFDIEILETHHRMKKDAPSGTALRMAEEIASAIGRSPSDFVTARQGETGVRGESHLGIQALRGGDVVGEHTVYFFGDGERVELTHRASSREQFAHGALRAAKWLAGKPAGLYDMADVLGLRVKP